MIDPCGRFVDWGREIGVWPARFGRDFDLPGKGRWYRCADDAPPMPFPHAFLAPWWEKILPGRPKGPAFLRSPIEVTTQPISYPTGEHIHGTEEQWQLGISQTEWDAHLAAGAPAYGECVLIDPPCHAQYPGFIWAACGRRTSFGRRQHCCNFPRVLNAGWELWGSSADTATARLLMQTRPYGALGPVTTHTIPIPAHGGNSLGSTLYTAEVDTELLASALYDPVAPTYFVNLGVFAPETLQSV